MVKKSIFLAVLLALLASGQCLAQNATRNDSGLNQLPPSQGSNPLPAVGATGAGASSPNSSPPEVNDSPTLRPEISKPLAPGIAPPAGWPANDMLPLGVDQFTNPTKLPDQKGPIGNFVQVVHDFTLNRECVNCTGVQVHVQNLSAKPIILDGEHAQLLNNGAPILALTEDQGLALSNKTFTKKQKELLAAVAIGTLGFAEPILQDHFTTSKTDFPVSYGPNEVRRRFEDRRFGKRIILPGETSDGILFFPGNPTNFDKISLPILTYPASQNDGALDILGGPTGVNTAALTTVLSQPKAGDKAVKVVRPKPIVQEKPAVKETPVANDKPAKKGKALKIRKDGY